MKTFSTMGLSRPLYDMPGKNMGRVFAGGLEQLSTAGNQFVFQDPETRNDWLDPSTLETLLDRDNELQQVLAEVVRGIESPLSPNTNREERILKKLEPHVSRVVQEDLLIDILERFERIKTEIVRYVLAKAAAKRTNPTHFRLKEAKA